VTQPKYPIFKFTFAKGLPLTMKQLMAFFSFFYALALCAAPYPCNTARTNNTNDTNSPTRSAWAADAIAPERASGYTPQTKVQAQSYMVVTANAHASKAGCEVLEQGGSAVDAAVAVQMVLGLVEPQSSGLGGGAFLLHFDAKTGAVQSYDGRETAPAAATEDYLRHISAQQRTPPLPVQTTRESMASFNALRQSGRAVGTPGVVRMLALAHQDHGHMAWKALFQAGVQLATQGFAISPRMADAIASNQTLLQTDVEAADYFLHASGAPKTQGTWLQNPAYAATLTALATHPDALYTGPIAQDIVKKIHMTQGGKPAFSLTPGLTTMADLAGYQALRRDPVCTTYRHYWVCGMGPPSAGGITVAATLGILENFDLPSQPPTAMDAQGGQPSPMGVHWVTEAERLAYADRNVYLADTDFVPLPGGSPAALLDKTYLHRRAQLINNRTSMGQATAGVFDTPMPGINTSEGNGTTHLTVVDRQGNVVVMTSTIESSMGSFRMAHGFLLNNQLTDFSVQPANAMGRIANRIQPGKRPRSSMAPTLVFRKAADGSRGDFVMATGSPGGPAIVQFVVKTLVGALDWGMDAQQATSMMDFGAANSATTYVGGEHPNIDITAPPDGQAGDRDALVRGLRKLGHTVNLGAQISGTSTIVKTQQQGMLVLEGGADPRREGLALGDTFSP
jgi:gamma-glutamyltranspeptidase / glutathione hydrolase